MLNATESGPVPTSALARSDRRLGMALAEHLIAGVGTGETYRHTKLVAMHARRALSPRELAELDPEWLAIPAVDMG